MILAFPLLWAVGAAAGYLYSHGRGISLTTAQGALARGPRPSPAVSRLAGSYAVPRGPVPGGAGRRRRERRLGLRPGWAGGEGRRPLFRRPGPAGGGARIGYQLRTASSKVFGL